MTAPRAAPTAIVALATLIAACGPATATPSTRHTVTGTPHPRATFVVTVKRRTVGHVKMSSWTNLPIRPNGTLQTAAHGDARKATALASASPLISR